MRGPGYKIAGDVRRTWRCSRCGCERKLAGDITSLLCGCQDGEWMQIVAETIMRPRPLQRPSDVERFPIEFGIEPNAPLPAKPVATIIKPAVSQEPDPIVTADEQEIEQGPVQDPPLEEEEWGEGIL